MDRGVRIAILAACGLSLGLGLIWDSVIDASREIILEERASGDMGPDPAVLKVGDTRLPAPERQEDNAPVSEGGDVLADPQAREHAAPEWNSSSPTVSAREGNARQSGGAQDLVSLYGSDAAGCIEDGKYVVQGGDNWWKIAYTRFKTYGGNQHKNGAWDSTSDWIERWQQANPAIMQKRGNDIRPGDKLNIPQ